MPTGDRDNDNLRRGVTAPLQGGLGAGPDSAPGATPGSTAGAAPDPTLGAADDFAAAAGVDWDSILAQLASQPLEDGWVTLQEASSATGAALSTLRSWYRSSQIPSRMVVGAHGPQRLVLLEAVVDRALRSSRARQQLEHSRSLDAEVDALRRRVEALERHLGLS